MIAYKQDCVADGGVRVDATEQSGDWNFAICTTLDLRRLRLAGLVVRVSK